MLRHIDVDLAVLELQITPLSDDEPSSYVAMGCKTTKDLIFFDIRKPYGLIYSELPAEQSSRDRSPERRRYSAL